MSAESDILAGLFTAWTALAEEFVAGAPDVRALYIYASSERGMTVANLYVDQRGSVRHPGRVDGIPGDTARVSRLQDLLTEDLFDAEDALSAAGIPRPTEYRILFDPVTRALDVQLSHDEQYAADDGRSPIRGVEYWLGDRAPTL
ncbi:hypothetical protein [Microbacterium testaceum]|uniref:hypothetical protein n=1 Tax=Microbacterium testaceum TaxID=2033 RepID=UPI0022E55404|nr:hypothetical protein [Microbacterium testaceum]